MRFARLLALPALAALVVGGTTAVARAETLTVSPSSSETLTASGRSGGPVASDNCGAIAQSPNQTLRVTERVDRMKLQVRAQGGQPTLLVRGPEGEFCALASEFSGGPQMSGIWQAGTYRIYVGEQGQGSHPYTLRLSR